MKVQNNMHFVQKNSSPPLDRLSALLAGLSPRVSMQKSPANESGVLSFPVEADAALWLHMVLDGSVRLLLAD
jgi:hypothetical protein